MPISLGVRRAVVAVSAVVVLVLLALAGGVGRGSASPGGVSTTFTVLNDVSATIQGQPTPGGNIGYAITVTNNTNRALQDVNLSEGIGDAGLVALINATGISCSGLNAKRMTCHLTSLASGGSFSVTVLFRTDPSAAPGSQVTNKVIGTFKNDTFGPGSVSRTYANTNSGSVTQSLALPTQQLTAGGPTQTSGVTMPGGFVNNYNWVGTTLNNHTGTTCPTCLPYITDITIPAASSFTTSGPFFDALSNTQPFEWRLFVPKSAVPLGFVPTTVFHNGVALPNCAIVAGNPVPNTSPPGICVTSLARSSVDDSITATGLALSNGSYWIG